jgi:DNA repair exonuclease SbcCD ATPase subunit
MAKEETKATKSEMASSGGKGSVDDIRDILFGNQMHEYEKKFAKLEELMTGKLSELREENRKRLDSLESFVKNEFESIDERMKTDRKERIETDKNLESEIKSTNRVLDEKSAQIQDQAAQNEKNLRIQILDQSKTLRDEIQQTREGLDSTIQRISSELREDKMDRGSLANLLNKMAVAISQDAGGSKEGF